MMFKQKFIELCNKRNESPSSVCRKVGITPATFSGYTDESVPRKATLMRIADYFGVTVDYLLGKEETKKATPDYSDVKVALFGGDGEVTDEMWDEVKQFADYVKAKYLKEKQ